MSTKLKIDLTQGILEVEGSETFVKAIYSDFKVHFIGDEAGEELTIGRTRRRRSRTQKSPKETQVQSQPDASVTPQTAAEPLAAEAAAPPEKGDTKSGPRFLKDLDLTATDDRVSLVEFMDTKFPITNEERNLVFLYYLQYISKAKRITIDHIFTCYKAANIRAPLNLESSIKITVNQRRWIKMTKTGRLSVTPAGKLYVEKQLPKKVKN